MMADAESNGNGVESDSKRNSQPAVLEQADDIQMTDLNFYEGSYEVRTCCELDDLLSGCVAS